MAELATGAGVAELISFSVLLFRGCVKAIQLISDARYAGEHVDRASCLLEYEEYRLLQWGDRVGLSDANPENQRLNWELIRKLLKQLHDLLTDANSLKVRYGLEALDAPSSGSKQPIPAKDSNKKGNRAFRSFWTDVSPAIKATRMTALEQDLGAFKKLRWVSLDQEKIHGLLAHIAHYNNCLRALLDSAEQTFVRRGLSALLRDAVSRTTNNTDVSLLQMLLDDEAVLEAAEINAAASLKQSRLKLGFDKRADEMTMNKTAQMTHAQTNATTATRSKISQLNYRSLTRSTNATTMLDREIATYRGGKWDMHSSVLLEWKYVKKSDDKVLEKRIQSLAYLMGQLDGASFHSLRSLGYLKQELANDCYLYAYVFELTDLNKSQEVVEPALRPLSVLFTASRSPSLSERLYIAVTIAETVLQLHTAGWLHKRISAKNVLFVDNGPLTWECSTSRGPFLAGYEFSRNVHATTEEMQDNAEAALRQHPLVGKGPFRKVYDLYALGCLMLELVFWQSLEDVLCISVENRPEPVLNTASEDVLLEEHQSRDAKILRGKELLLDHNNFSSFILDAVAHKSGDVWRDIVNLCFFPEETESTDGCGGELEDILETSVRTQIRIVDLLRSINV